MVAFAQEELDFGVGLSLRHRALDDSQRLWYKRVAILLNRTLVLCICTDFLCDINEVAGVSEVGFWVRISFDELSVVIYVVLNVRWGPKTDNLCGTSLQCFGCEVIERSETDLCPYPLFQRNCPSSPRWAHYGGEGGVW